MVEDVTPDEIAERIEDDDAPQIVDVRKPTQFRQAHIPGAENVPFPELPRKVEQIDWDDEIVVACAIGKSSQKAARMLESYEGVDDDADVYNLDGGVRAWDHDLASGRDDAGTDRAGASDEGPGSASGDADAPF
ncbi:rhodanese-like domain-containing protein [Natronoarchaeum rubrum]|uniref:rhodanese-like domain-containing protein n=1 Tax=Natronoarchaeum rubrum TaxID=755311 RepID=UPI0021133203|nr:rhodanese-like domain-containing protein [Natronoarchaeum rubrum]HMB50588.1 rhodanese-like domain-containing protein [Natronoarchaeum rubrum]